MYVCMYVCMYVYKYSVDVYLLCMIKFMVRWCNVVCGECNYLVLN